MRKYALAKVIKPGIKLIDMCEKIENATRAYLEADRGPTAGVKAGIGFPTGCSINSCAAHYTPNPGDKTVLKYDDVMKLDFGGGPSPQHPSPRKRTGTDSPRSTAAPMVDRRVDEINSIG